MTYPHATTGQTRPLALSDDQQIEIVSRLAAGAAMDAVRQRFNLAIGLFGAVFALAGGSALILLDDRIEALAGPAVEAGIRDRLATSSLLPLVVSEAITFRTEGGYTPAKADRVLGALETLAPEILMLDGVNRELALRGLEDIIDSFWKTGDYYRTFQAYELFGDQILEFDGIAWTVGISLASQFVIHGRMPKAFQDVERAFLAHSFDPDGEPFEMKRILIGLDAVVPAGVKKAQVMAFVEAEAARFSKFPVFLLDMIETLDEELAPGGRNHSVGAAKRHRALKNYAAEAVRRLVPDEDI